jgi:DNA-3-methyladenine glycosylase II
MQDAEKKLAAADPVMARLMEMIGPLDFTPRRLPTFQALIRSIIHQQLSGQVAEAILDRFIALFGEEDFPSPQAIAAMDFERMRAVGLSRPKTAYIKEVAEMTLKGAVPSLEECDRSDDRELHDRLIGIKGVGPWTVQMVLIFNIGRPDILPTRDLGIQKGFQIAYRKKELPNPEQLERFGKRWKPYRTTAALYLWRAVDSLNREAW